MSIVLVQVLACTRWDSFTHHSSDVSAKFSLSLLNILKEHDEGLDLTLETVVSCTENCSTTLELSSPVRVSHRKVGAV